MWPTPLLDMNDPLVESKQAEAAQAAAVAKEADHRSLEVMQEKFIKDLNKALTYDGGDRPALVARIPVICNDIRWIKLGIMGIFALLGTLLVALLVK